MTIRTCINASALNRQLNLMEACAENSPEGTYLQANDIVEIINRAACDLIAAVRAAGLKADNCDGIREVEAVIYGYIKDSNPDATIFPTAEGFGEAMDGPARERVIAQASSNLQQLRALGVVGR